MSKANRPCSTCGTITYQARNGLEICPLCGLGSSQYKPPFTITIPEVTYYHTNVFQLANLTVTISQEQIWVLRQVEYLLRRKLPASFFEWFVGLALPDLLASRLGDAQLINLVQAAKRLDEPILPFLLENQGVCQWGIALDDGDDPLVLGKIEDTYWQTCASNFSDFVYWTFYDGRIIGAADFAAQTPPITKDCLRLVGSTFVEQAQTYKWPGRSSRRFQNEAGSILIWSSKTQTDWWIAPAQGQMLAMLEYVWGCEDIPHSLYAMNDAATITLRQFRFEREGQINP